MNVPAESPEKIDQQLDFILESIRKQKKKETKAPTKSGRSKRIRTRKTSTQLEYLQNELKETEVLDKHKLKLLAEKTGLSEAQIYKWFWDRRRKKEQVVPSSL